MSSGSTSCSRLLLRPANVDGCGIAIKCIAAVYFPVDVRLQGDATCVPHPFLPLRLEGWLRRLDEQREQREQQLQQAAATAS